jgi:DNA-binding NtrC family response regulator
MNWYFYSRQTELIYTLKLNMDPVIHIVDRSRTYRKIVEECLTALGYSNVAAFENPEELLSFKLAPDIIILDHETDRAQLSGLEFFRQYGNSRFRHTRFIFLSSDTNLHIAVSAIRLGAFDYIVKSKQGLERLITHVEKLVESHRINYRRERFFNAALLSLGMVSFLFLLVIFLYSHQNV